MAFDSRDIQRPATADGGGPGPAAARPAVEPSRPGADVARSDVKSFGIIVGVFILLLVIALAASWGAL